MLSPLDANGRAQAVKILNMIKLFERPIKVNKSQKERGGDDDVGANLFVGNLDPEVDEKYLYDTFSAFGVVTRTPKVMRDPDTGASRGFGFVTFAVSFSALCRSPRGPLASSVRLC